MDSHTTSSRPCPAAWLAAALLCGAPLARAVNEFPPPPPRPSSAVWAAKAASGIAPTKPATEASPSADRYSRRPPKEAPSQARSNDARNAAVVLGAAALVEGLGLAELRKQNRALHAQNEALQQALGESKAHIDELGRANTDLERRVEQQSREIAEQKGELTQALRDRGQDAAGREALKQQLADSQKTVQAQKQRLAQAAQALAQAGSELDIARQQRPTWAALAAVLGAGLAAGAVRAWWPRKLPQPFSVAVSAGRWSVGAAIPTDGAGIAFRLTTHWEPGPVGVQAHAPGGLLRRPDIVSIHGEAA